MLFFKVFLRGQELTPELVELAFTDYLEQLQRQRQQ